MVKLFFKYFIKLILVGRTFYGLKVNFTENKIIAYSTIVNIFKLKFYKELIKIILNI